MESIVFGAGYVGLVQAAGLATAGNHVTLADISEERIELLRSGGCPIHEPQLPELLNKGKDEGCLDYVLVGSDEYLKKVKDAEIIFIAVQTPQTDAGEVNLEYVFSVVDQLASLDVAIDEKIIVTKSTVPVGTGDKIEARFQKAGKKPIVASNPEFLKQGSAVQDFLKPERVIIGTNHPKARELLSFLYHPFMIKKDRSLLMSRRSAELVKYACNAFLATKISFINEVALLAESAGADIRDIRRGMISDSRIGDQFLFPGVGYGGSCFPKDTLGLLSQGKSADLEMPIVEATARVNQRQKNWAYQKVKKALGNLEGKKIALWGLSFKPNTDDLREAPSIHFIKQVTQEGATVIATDPVAMENTKKQLPQLIESKQLCLVSDPYAAAEGADALVVVTEWLQYRSPNFSKLSKTMKNKLLLDGRNLYGPEITKEYGFTYFGVGIGV